MVLNIDKNVRMMVPSEAANGKSRLERYPEKRVHVGTMKAEVIFGNDRKNVT